MTTTVTGHATFNLAGRFVNGEPFSNKPVFNASMPDYGGFEAAQAAALELAQAGAARPQINVRPAGPSARSLRRLHVRTERAIQNWGNVKPQALSEIHVLGTITLDVKVDRESAYQLHGPAQLVDNGNGSGTVITGVDEADANVHIVGSGGPIDSPTTTLHFAGESIAVTPAAKPREAKLPDPPATRLDPTWVNWALNS